MTTIFQPDINDHLMIEIPVGNGFRAFPTRLISLDQVSFSILTPVEKGQVFRVKTDQEVRVHFSKHGTFYMLHTKCIQSIHGREPRLRLELEGSIELIQRREFYRVAAEVPVRLEIISPGDPGKTLKQGFFMTCDISGGGVSIKGVPSWVTADMMVKVEIPRGGGITPISCSGIVVRCILPDDMDKNTIAVVFTDISEKDRDRIIRLVFKLEVEGKKPDSN